MSIKVNDHSLYNVINSLVTSLISLTLALGVTVLNARLLGPENKGIYDLVLATINLLAIGLGWSLPSGITYVIASQATAISALTKILFILAIVQGIIAVGLLSLLNKINYFQWLLPTQVANSGLISVIGLSLVFTLINNYWRAILVGYQEIIKANKFDLIGKLVYPLLLLTSAIVLPRMEYYISPLFCILLNLFAIISTSIIFFTGLYSYLSDTVPFSNILKIIFYSTPCYFGNLLQFLNYKLDIFFVANYSTNIADVGFYTLAASLAQLIWLVPNAAATVIFPKVAAEKGVNDQNTKKNIALTARLVFWISLLIGALMALFIPLFVPIVYGKSFQAIIPAFMWLLPGVISLSGASPLAAYIAGIGKIKINLFVSFISFIVTITFDIFLIPREGIIGAAIASSLSYTVTTILTIAILNNRLGISWRDVLILRTEDMRMIFSRIYAISRMSKKQ